MFLVFRKFMNRWISKCPFHPLFCCCSYRLKSWDIWKKKLEKKKRILRHLLEKSEGQPLPPPLLHMRLHTWPTWILKVILCLKIEMNVFWSEMTCLILVFGILCSLWIVLFPFSKVFIKNLFIYWNLEKTCRQKWPNICSHSKKKN